MSKNNFLKIAGSIHPALHRNVVKPVRTVHIEQDASSFQGWRVNTDGTPEAAYETTWGRQGSVVYDFGTYCTGNLRFEIAVNGIVDCPLRLHIVFGEVPAEIAEPFSEYHGDLGRAWLQEEILVLDEPAGTIDLPRRYSFRYVKIAAQYNAPGYKVSIRNPEVTTVTSASATVSGLTAVDDTLLECIDAVSLATLKNCMQTVFEDGPKRDRRLWLGDFRLQALVNYVSYKNYDLCKRCLYLFAGLADDNGLVPSCLYERPEPHAGTSHIYDYTALFAPTLAEYAEASGDWDTAADLWPVAVRQMQIILEEIDENGLFHDRQKWWLFIDWNPKLDKQASEQGVVIYSLRSLWRLAVRLNKEFEAAWVQPMITKMTDAAVRFLYDTEKKLFISGVSRQVSWASQAWMTLAGVMPDVMERITDIPDAVKPAGPYLYHYVVDAMMSAGHRSTAEDIMKDYWGGMIHLGADTFWEVFDPADHLLSPYKSHLMNSYCHAWSCTPAYFLRRSSVVTASERFR